MLRCLVVEISHSYESSEGSKYSVGTNENYTDQTRNRSRWRNIRSEISFRIFIGSQIDEGGGKNQIEAFINKKFKKKFTKIFK